MLVFCLMLFTIVFFFLVIIFYKYLQISLYAQKHVTLLFCTIIVFLFQSTIWQFCFQCMFWGCLGIDYN